MTTEVKNEWNCTFTALPPILRDGSDRDRDSFTSTFCLLFDSLTLHHFMVQFLLSSRRSLNIRPKFGRSSLPVHPAEIGTDAGISKPTTYKQNLTQLQQITEVPSVVSSHIPGTSVRRRYLKFLRK